MKQSFKSRMVCFAVSGAIAMALPGQAMAQASDPFVGQLALVGFNFCPNNWAEANGQLLPINQNQALFALFGTMYGGDGRTNFALPDLRGRVPVHSGQGVGLSPHYQGETGGSESFTLQVSQMPAHNHAILATSEPANRPGPLNKLLARDDAVNKFSDTTLPPDKVMNPAMVGNTGGGQPVAKRDPFLAMKYCVSLFGVFPQRP